MFACKLCIFLVTVHLSLFLYFSEKRLSSPSSSSSTVTVNLDEEDEDLEVSDAPLLKKRRF